MPTHFTHAIIAASLLSVHIPLIAQDGISWLHPAAPFDLRSSAFMQLHAGEHHGGSFGLANVASVELFDGMRAEGALLLDGRHANSGRSLSMHSTFGAGLRYQHLSDELFSLPVHAGAASVLTRQSGVDGARRITLIYAGVRPSFRLLDGFELVGSAGLLWIPHSDATQVSASIGIRAASVFTFSFDLSSLMDKPGREPLPSQLLR
jgi:hypothetical protein